MQRQNGCDRPAVQWRHDRLVTTVLDVHHAQTECIQTDAATRSIRINSRYFRNKREVIWAESEAVGSAIEGAG